jgi:UrcA family protein
MKTALRSTLVLALSLASTLAVAGVAQADTDTDPSSVKVTLSDLDLSSSQGQSIAHRRVHKAAQLACTRSMDPYKLAPHYEYVNCVVSSEQRAMQQLQAGPIVASK